MKTYRFAAILVAALLVSTCSGQRTAPTEPTQPTSTQPSTNVPTAAGPPAVFVGAGDIADCTSNGSELTARLLDVIPGTVFTAGDNAYPSGTPDDYRRCYAPTWGRHAGRTRPSPGNHEYTAPGAPGYFGYFGASAGPAGVGYYSYNLGSWHVLSLNSEIDMRNGSAQVNWLRLDLDANRTACTIAYFHRPLFSSGPHGPSPQVRELWQVLYAFDVDVIVTGHDHLYERFGPQDPNGQADPARGIRQFVVGTGGAERYERGNRMPNSEVVGRDWGVLALTLESQAYRWEFVPVAGATFRDSGTGTCH